MKRYAVTLELFIYAHDDANARLIADLIADSQRFQYDNHARVTSLTRSNFGKIETPKNIIQ